MSILPGAVQGGVLFNDEAYSLIPRHEKDFGHEAIATIIQEMKNRRDEVLVIFCGLRGFDEGVSRYKPRSIFKDFSGNHI